jgi:hypothetical protein
MNKAVIVQMSDTTMLSNEQLFVTSPSNFNQQIPPLSE